MGVADIPGRIAFITGGARGIGRAIAEELVAQGAHVALADRDLQTAERTAEALASRDTRARAYELDVRDRAAWDTVLDQVERDLGPVDLLINNAGIMPLGDFLALDEGVDRLQIDVNLYGVIHGMRATIPRMQRRKRGHIVNIASIAGKAAAPNAAVYSACKHAVVGLTEAVNYEQRDSGISFTYVCPSLVQTELISGTNPLKWPRPVQPRDVAVAVVDAIRTEKVDVFVPKSGRISIILPALLPRRVYTRIGELLGVGDVFAGIDDRAREAYRKRILQP